VSAGAALTMMLGACSLAPPLKTPDVQPRMPSKKWALTQAQPADRLRATAVVDALDIG